MHSLYGLRRNLVSLSQAVFISPSLSAVMYSLLLLKIKDKSSTQFQNPIKSSIEINSRVWNVGWFNWLWIIHSGFGYFILSNWSLFSLNYIMVKEYEISYWGKVRVPCMQHLLWINWNYIMSNCLEYVLYFPSGVNDMSFYDRLLILLWKYPHMICAHSNAIAVDAESWNSCSILRDTNSTPAVHSLLLPTKVRLSPNLLVICVRNANTLVSRNGFKNQAQGHLYDFEPDFTKL